MNQTTPHAMETDASPRKPCSYHRRVGAISGCRRAVRSPSQVLYNRTGTSAQPLRLTAPFAWRSEANVTLAEFPARTYVRESRLAQRLLRTHCAAERATVDAPAGRCLPRATTSGATRSSNVGLCLQPRRGCASQAHCAESRPRRYGAMIWRQRRGCGLWLLWRDCCRGR